MPKIMYKWPILVLCLAAVITARRLHKVLILDRVGTGNDTFFHPDYFNNFSVSLRHVDRSAKGMIVLCDLKTDMDFPVTGSMKLLKLVNKHHYEDTALAFSYDYCKYFKLITSDNVISLPKCPIKKGRFSETSPTHINLDNYLLDQVPLWSFKYVAELRRTDDSVLLLRWSVYGHMDQE